jgi:type IV secretory pathway TrbD component
VAQKESWLAFCSALAWPSPQSISSLGSFLLRKHVSLRLKTLMAQARRINTVYRTLHRPLTVLGVERKLFFFAMCMGAATFNMLSSLLGGILMFFLLYLAAQWATKTDPQILRFLLSAAKFKTQYDPSKLSPVAIRRASNA